MGEKVPIVAYLGPEGTFTHQAAVEHFSNAKVVLEPHATISETFNAALAQRGEARIAFVPWENSMHGQVVDTYDALRMCDVGTRAVVRGEHTIAIEHCLLVREGTRIGDVRRVLSHEQALGQCKVFLAKFLPHVTLVRVASTAAAAQGIAESTSPRVSGDAAICARICAKTYPGLEILRDGIQDEPNNTTRFMIVAPRDAAQHLPFANGRRWRGLIRVTVDKGRIGAVVGRADLRIRQIDRRPSLRVREEDYFLEVEDEGACDETEWMASLLAAAGRVDGAVLGLWLI